MNKGWSLAAMESHEMGPRLSRGTRVSCKAGAAAGWAEVTVPTVSGEAVASWCRQGLGDLTSSREKEPWLASARLC